jgi:hypothetical protein
MPTSAVMAANSTVVSKPATDVGGRLKIGLPEI